MHRFTESQAEERVGREVVAKRPLGGIATGARGQVMSAIPMPYLKGGGFWLVIAFVGVRVERTSPGAQLTVVEFGEARAISRTRYETHFEEV